MLSSKSALNTHQTKTKYCLKIQGKTNIKGKFVCKLCNKNFLNNNRYKYHINICKSDRFYIKELEKLKEENQCLKEENSSQKKENEILKAELEKFRDDYKELSLTAVKRPTTNNKNIQINNFINKMEPLRLVDIQSSVPMLTLDHHVKGAEGYAEFALELPFKDKIVCVDVNRNKIKYKNEEGDIIEDMGFQEDDEQVMRGSK